MHAAGRGAASRRDDPDGTADPPPQAAVWVVGDLRRADHQALLEQHSRGGGSRLLNRGARVARV